MTSYSKMLGRAQEGTAAIEMAIALPVLILFIYGIFTFGQVFEADAGIQHALGEGARFGTLCLNPSSGSCTLPTATQIKARVNSRLFGTTSGTFDAPTVDTSTASSGYVTVTVTYHQTMYFAFFTGPTITLTRSKLVYLAETPPASGSTSCSAGGGSTPASSCSVYL
jgi:Flp pilus assembly protein TadG